MIKIGTITWFCRAIFGVVILIFALTTFAQSELTGADLVASMLSPDSCANPPCFLNHSLDTISITNIGSILEESELVNDVVVATTANEVHWIWSDDTVRRLTSGRLDTLTLVDDNLIRFDRNGNVVSYDLAVHISFGEMLNTFGDEFIVLPWTSHRVLGAGYVILYPQLQGYFIVFTDCEDPQITEATGVISYTYRRIIPVEIHTVGQFSIWNGYDTALPNCSTFPTG